MSKSCWIIVLLPSTACGGIRPTETADGGYLRLPTEEQYLIYNSPYRQATFIRYKIALTMTMRLLGLFQQITCVHDHPQAQVVSQLLVLILDSQLPARLP
jgi:hypothetical protein